MEDFPKKIRTHQLETISERYFTSLFPTSWISAKPQEDYGIDLTCQIVQKESVIGHNFSVQLKCKEEESTKDSISVCIKRTTINLWFARLEPIMLVVYSVKDNEAYWTWVENDFVDLTKKQSTYKVKISKEHKYSQISWDSVATYVATIFNKRHFLYSDFEITIASRDAWENYFNQNFDKALPLLYSLLEKDPKNVNLLQAISQSEYELYNYQKALQYINKALSIDNNNALLINKGSIISEQGVIEHNNSKIEEALKIFHSIEEEEFQNHYLFFNIGTSYNCLGEYEKGMYYFRKSLLLDKNNAKAWSNLGNSYMYLDLHEFSILCFDNALEIDPNLEEALFTKGSTLYKHFDKVDEGLELMLEATTKSKRYEIPNPYVFFWIAEAYLTKKDNKNALKWNEKGLVFFERDDYLIMQKERITKNDR